MPSAQILRALRYLQLPYKQEIEAACADELVSTLEVFGVAQADALAWVELQVGRWVADTASADLKRVVSAIGQVASAAENEGVRLRFARLMAEYFSCHAALMREHGLKFPEATALLSHASLMLNLADSELLSAAQISRMLSPRDARARFSRHVVAEVLKAARANKRLTREQVQALFEQDKADELAAFSDASLLIAAEEVARIASMLGLSAEFEQALVTLAPQESEDGLVSEFTPYLQILHYQCCIAEFYDHAIVDLYEFTPRGEAANWLFQQYPHSIAGASNPFLNNAKAVEVLDEAWVRSREGAQSKAARSLFLIVSQLDSLGFSARREIARWIRLWLIRVIRLAAEIPFDLPGGLAPAQIHSLLSETSRSNTGTFGIIEQRTLDAVASLLHPGWRSLGVGDAINATNISRRKMGDCEFLDPRRREIQAYEAHGGALTNVYMQQHLLTLRKTLLRRVEELNAVADIAEWSLVLNFVAHDISAAEGRLEIFEGLRIQMVPRTFSEVFGLIAGIEEVPLMASFQDSLLRPMRERRTPNIARTRLLQLIR